MKKFLNENKVTLISALGAVAIVLQQAMGEQEISWPAIAFAAVVAFLGRIARAWRGKGLTMVGIIGTVAYAFSEAAMGGAFSWDQFILSAMVALIAAAGGSLNLPKEPGDESGVPPAPVKEEVKQ